MRHVYTYMTMLGVGLLGCGESDDKSSETTEFSTNDWGASSGTDTADAGADGESDSDGESDGDGDANGDVDADADGGANSDLDDGTFGDTDVGSDTGGIAGGFGAGEADSVSTEVCAFLELGSAIPVVLASTPDEAAMASVTLGSTNELVLAMPEMGDGYLQLEVPDWMTTVRIFSHGDATYEILTAEEGGERVAAGSCPEEGITDHLWFFHEWGSYTIRIAEGSPAETWLTLYKV